MARDIDRSHKIYHDDISFKFIREAKKKGVKSIVKLSAMGADSESTSTILRLHRMEEKIMQDSELPYTFLRPSAFMQIFVTQFGGWKYMFIQMTMMLH